MGAEIGNPDDDFSGFTTPLDSVRPKRGLASVPERVDVEEPQAADDVEIKPAAKKPATTAAMKRPAAKKTATKKPPIPASQPPSKHKVAIPPELYREMHRVKNRWLQADDDRMDAYSQHLNVGNTFMVTLMAFATAILKEELEKDGGASTTFPDFIPRKNEPK